MNINNIIRAWKDEAFRQSLTQTERATLPENPAGALELSDAELGEVNGAAGNFQSIFCTVQSNCACVPPTFAAVCTLPPKKKG